MMTNSSKIKEIVDSIEEKRLLSLALEFIDKPLAIRQEILHKKNWIAVPVESAAHFNDRDACLLVAAFALIKITTIKAVVAEPIAPDPQCYEITPTKEGIMAFSKRFAFLNFLLFSDEITCLILCTTADYFVVSGSRSFVKMALGKSIGQAQADFLSYVLNSGWDANDRKRLLAVAQKYGVPEVPNIA